MSRRDNIEHLRRLAVRGIVEKVRVTEAEAMPYVDAVIGIMQTEYAGTKLYLPPLVRRPTVDAIRDALEKEGACVTEVCKRFGLSRSKLYRLFPGGLPRTRARSGALA